MLINKRVVCNIGAKILIFTSNLQNSTLRGRTQMSGGVPESPERDEVF